MTALAYSGDWQRIRTASYRSGIWIGQLCPRCFLPMWPGQRLHLGHVVDVAAGGMGGPLRWEHASCNEAAGARAGSARRKARLERVRSPAERARHNHLVAMRQRRAWKLADQEFEKSEHGRVWLLVRPSGTE